MTAWLILTAIVAGNAPHDIREHMEGAGIFPRALWGCGEQAYRPFDARWSCGVDIQMTGRELKGKLWICSQRMSVA